MRTFKRRVNSFALFSFAIFGLFMYIFDKFNKSSSPLEIISHNEQIVLPFKNPIEIVVLDEEKIVEKSGEKSKEINEEQIEKENEEQTEQLTEEKNEEQIDNNNSESNTMEPTEFQVDHYLYISECACQKRFRYPPSDYVTEKDGSPIRFNSSCSDQGTLYKNKQKVVTFSLYVDSASSQLEKKYEVGLIENLNMIRKHYPGYSLRLYTNIRPSTYYCTLLCTNEDLFWCVMQYVPSHGDLSGMVFRTWRFLALGDPTVDLFLSRDLDSLVSAREAAVVEDWLSKEDKAISVMRDRPGGHNFSMLAGMWEASNTRLGMDVAGNLREMIIELSSMANETYKTSDQDILEWTVFKLHSENIVAYDSYNCVKWANYTLVKPYPIQRDDPTVDFVGNRVDFEETGKPRNYTAIECPIECRPSYGQNWTYC